MVRLGGSVIKVVIIIVITILVVTLTIVVGVLCRISKHVKEWHEE